MKTQRIQSSILIRNLVGMSVTALIASILVFNPVPSDAVPAPTAPGGISKDLMVWLDASDIDGNGVEGDNPADGSTFTAWTDKSGLGNHARVRSGQNPGTYRSDPVAMINGKPTVRFNRVNDSKGTVFQIPVDLRPVSAPDVTVFSVYRPSSKIANAGVWGTDNGNWDRFYLSYHPAFGNKKTDGVVGLGPRDKGAVVSNAAEVGTTRLLTVRYNGKVTNGINSGPVGASAVYFDGQVVRTFTDTADATDAQTNVGLGWDGDNSVYEGDISEFIIYKRALSQTEIVQVTEYLSNKHDIAKVGVDVTASSPAALTYGHVLPTISYSTNPTSTASNWDMEPTCAVYATGDIGFATPLVGNQPSGAYVTHCQGGESQTHVVDKYIDGLLRIDKKPVEVLPSGDNVIDFGTTTPSYNFVTDLDLVSSDWSVPPTCSVYDFGDSTFLNPLTGVLNVGTYIVHCSGGVSDNFGPISYINRELQVAALDLLVSPSSVPTFNYGEDLPAVTHVTDLGIARSEWSVEPTCAIYALGDVETTSPLVAPLDAGLYLTHCSGGLATNFPQIGYEVGSIEVLPMDITVTAQSPTDLVFGTRIPTIGYSATDIAGHEWISEPICEVYANADTTFALPLQGILAAGTYDTQCQSGDSHNYAVAQYVKGSLVVKPKPVSVSPVSPKKFGYGISLNRIEFKSVPKTSYDDWKIPPSCFIYARSDSHFRKPLSGRIPSGTYRTTCHGGVSKNYVIDSYRHGQLTIYPVVRAVSVTVYFDVLASVMLPSEKAKLNSLVKARVKSGAFNVLVHGYVQPTMNTGNDKSLSTRRAHAVTKYLQRLGLSMTHEVVGRGRGHQQGAKSRKVVVTIRYTTG